MQDLIECSLTILNLQDLVNSLDMIEKHAKSKAYIEAGIKALDKYAMYWSQ